MFSVFQKQHCYIRKYFCTYNGTTNIQTPSLNDLRAAAESERIEI